MEKQAGQENNAPCPDNFFSLGREKFFLGQGKMKVVLDMSVLIGLNY